MADPITRLEEMRVAAQSLLLEIDELTSITDPTDTELERLDAATTEADEIRTNIEAAEDRLAKAEARAKKVDEIRSFMRKPGYVVAPQGPDLYSKNNRDPFDMSDIRTLGVPQETVNREFRARAEDAIERAPEYVTHEQRGVAMKHVDNDATGEVAKHYLELGSPEYEDGFKRYMRTGEHRTALSTTGQNGGYFIPFFLDPTVIFTNTGTVNPFRQISRVVTIGSNVWHGISSDAVTAAFSAEAAEVTDNSPTFSQPTINRIAAFTAFGAVV